jgi:hypothetical protein
MPICPPGVGELIWTGSFTPKGGAVRGNEAFSAEYDFKVTAG